jgi:hypothetical protein
MALAAAGCAGSSAELIRLQIPTAGDFALVRIEASTAGREALPVLALSVSESIGADVRAVAAVSEARREGGRATASALVVVIHRRDSSDEGARELKLRVQFGDGASIRARVEGTMRATAAGPACVRTSLALSRSVRFLSLGSAGATSPRRTIANALEVLCGPLTPTVLAWIHREVDPTFLRR